MSQADSCTRIKIDEETARCHHVTMSDTFAVVVGPKGRVVIPAPLRAEIGVQTGDELVAFAEGGGVLLLPRSAVKNRLRAMFRGGPSLAGELIRERHEAARREAAE